jgi:hypothetical protein
LIWLSEEGAWEKVQSTCIHQCLGEGAKYMHSSVLGRRCKVEPFISAWEKVQSRTIHQCQTEKSSAIFRRESRVAHDPGVLQHPALRDMHTILKKNIRTTSLAGVLQDIALRHSRVHLWHMHVWSMHPQRGILRTHQQHFQCL